MTQVNYKCGNCHGEDIYKELLNFKEWDIDRQDWYITNEEIRYMCLNKDCETYEGNVEIYSVPIIGEE